MKKIKLLVCVLLMLSAVCSADEAWVSVDCDTFICSAKPDTNGGGLWYTEARMEYNSYAGSNVCYVLLDWRLGVPNGVSIDTARLHLFVDDISIWEGVHTVTVYTVYQPWDEDVVTWDMWSPGYYGAPFEEYEVFLLEEGWNVFDVTSMFDAANAGHGLLLEINEFAPPGKLTIRSHSSESMYTNRRPKLFLKYDIRSGAVPESLGMVKSIWR